MTPEYQQDIAKHFFKTHEQQVQDYRTALDTIDLMFAELTLADIADTAIEAMLVQKLFQLISRKEPDPAAQRDLLLMYYNLVAQSFGEK